MDLLADESEDEKVEFKINTNYAKNYETWRKKEERQRLIDRYGEDRGDSSSSSEEEEIRTSKQMDKDWLRAYAAVKFKQPRLYKEGEQFFKDTAMPVNSKKKAKATTLKDYERNFILKKGGIESDDESVEKPQGKSYYEEQDEIKKSLKEAIEASSGDESGSDDILVKKQKTEEDETQEQNDYLEWLKGEKTELGDKDAEAELAPLKAYWNNPDLDEKEKVLRDYVLNNGYMDQDDSEESSDQGPDPEEENAFLEEAEEYEHKYNFRHEEPGAEEIKSYPRVIETSVRPKDTRRAEKRQKRMEKKKTESGKRSEEIRLLQKLSQDERLAKLERLRRIAGNPDLDYDLDKDFDPEQHSKIMGKYFNEEYYGDEGDEKPDFEFDPAIDGVPDEGNGAIEDEEDGGDEGEEGAGPSGVDLGPGVDDPDFNMDADYDASNPTQMMTKAEKRRAKKYGKAFAKKLPIFDPTTKTFDEYIAEYLQDKINTLPFPYREVVPNDFGLSTEEILVAPERELNAWVSVKKMSEYRSKQEEQAEVKKFAQRARQEDRKFKMLPSLLKQPEEVAKEMAATRKKKKKKRRKPKTEENEEPGKSDEANEPDNSEDAGVTDSLFAEEAQSSGNDKKKKVEVSKKENKVKKRKLNETVGEGEETNSQPLVKKKKKEKVSDEQMNISGKVNDVDDKKSGVSIAHAVNETTTKKKKKKKKKTDEQLLNSGTVKVVGENKESQVVNGTTTTKKKKKKKKNVAKKNEIVDKTSSEDVTNRVKKKKKSIPNYEKDGKETQVINLDNKQIKKRLEQVVSSSRLEKFGLGITKRKRKRKSKHAAVSVSS